jgi:hypothetical protein
MKVKRIIITSLLSLATFSAFAEPGYGDTLPTWPLPQGGNVTAPAASGGIWFEPMLG